MSTLSFDEKYAVIGTQPASHYEGVFFTGVKTTGIFCRPTCTARKPKYENVEFFATTQQALRAGYRPCKRCKPMQSLAQTPDEIAQLIAQIHEQPFHRITDAVLREMGLAPHTIRRWFKQHHNMTFQGYARMIRINLAFRHLQNGGSVTDSAFTHGYNSLSGFLSRYHQVFGASPTKTTKNQQVISIVRFDSPLGPMFAAATHKGLCLLEFTDRRMLETEFADLCKRLNAVILPGNNAHLEATKQQIDEYFAGQRKHFTLALDTPTTPFRQLVWNQLQAIEYGTTASYKQQAIAIGREQAVRAVASANGHNRIAIIIPCHRVIGSNGQLVGYAGGLERKQYLLDLEQRNK